MSAVKKLIFETKKILFCIINVRDILIFIVQNAEIKTIISYLILERGITDR